MLTVTQHGDFKSTIAMLKLAASPDFLSTLESFGARGVDALSQATPVDSGESASKWAYVIQRTPTSITISWENTSMAGTVPVVILLQYGHATIHGGYVQGRDFINPAIKPIFDEITTAAWEHIKKK